MTGQAMTILGPGATQMSTGARVAPIVPTNVYEVAEVANAVITAGLAPSSYGIEPKSNHPDEIKRARDETRARIIIGIMRGAEVGFPPITALSTIFIVNNRPCLWGDAAMALCQSRGLVERVELTWEGTLGGTKSDPVPNDFGDDYACVFKVWRRGQKDPFVGRFSVRDAKRAHLWGRKQPWVQYPTRMLLARARAFAMRDGFADALMGLAIAEEVQDLPAEAAVTDKSFLDDDPATTVTVAVDTTEIEPVAPIPPSATVSPGPSDPAAVPDVLTDTAGPGEPLHEEAAPEQDTTVLDAAHVAEMTAWGTRATKAVATERDLDALEKIERFIRRDLAEYALCVGAGKALALEELIAIRRGEIASQ